MTEPLTPKQARDDSFILSAAMDVTLVANGIEFDRKKFVATLRAYADQAERLKEIEGAVREMLPYYEDMETGDGEPCPQMARLRYLMEKVK